MLKQFLTTSPSQTKKLAKSFVKEIFKNNFKKTATIIGLIGDLGSGKTTFLQGFVKGLNIKEKILSPTFVLIKKYKIKNIKYKIQNFYHIDFYRIEKSKEILDLDFKKIIFNNENIVAIEWANKIKKLLPKNTIWINFQFIDKTKRKIIMTKKD